MSTDIIIVLTDQERAAPPYESDETTAWRKNALPGRRWFDEHGVTFSNHYTGSLACVPSRPTLFTGQYPDVHGVTQTDGLGKDADDSAMRWLRPDEVPTLGHWLRWAGYDTHYVGKWHISHADLHDPETGAVIATNDDAGVVDQAAVDRYLRADQLDEYGFSDWIGPEPHGAPLANSGLRRDGLYADRAVTWLTDRFERRQAGDSIALRPFLLVVSFVNPHDIVLFPSWVRNDPLGEDNFATPPIAAPPTADEDLSTKPAAQAAYRASYPTGYAPIADQVYDEQADRYRQLYYRLHAEVDQPIDRVRVAAAGGYTSTGEQGAILIRSADHGELLGAHGGLHQKWFTLYDEATRVPFTIAGLGACHIESRTVEGMITSHLDIVPTVLGFAGVDTRIAESELAQHFSELHPLPGVDLSQIISGNAAPDPDRAAYLLTRDNILEGDSGASVVARGFGLSADPPANMRIEVPAHVGSNFEAIVAFHNGDRWKLARTFDDPATWTTPYVEHLDEDTDDGPIYRTVALDDEWELYNLTDDPVEAINLWNDPMAADERVALSATLERERRRCLPDRHAPWQYATRCLSRPATVG